MPRSQFDRIRGVRWRPAIALAAVTATLVLGLSSMLGKPLPFTGFGWTIGETGIGPALDWLAIAALTLVAAVALPSLRLREIAVGPAKLSVGDGVQNYFDANLDELVYFFERSRTRVVVFEDLDRFNDAGIFVALRELNGLLRSSSQVRQPVTFV